ncbi:protein-S-isoprenylcysteine methyltransferase [Enterovibrio norvegicus FF-33]|uniref:Protein-S-isoprenylcysteine methyltransferase n=1 Tax=Enterovibrio norvegicus FF-454 TaxID=1185651 RepID=A0A1E5CBK7_9GAMM|nr:isoprenylcysteine carboxylmethyltransferase family protein [Enterovibrio norvegicus]OEE62845.1 protein-S-isoprenylcysteine methyltransferase [Enterovibrio norvegicus FF-454]OEE66769.1 protein-S-isoprenylcysteine methyltransferase [Enterovibrio norvegicus FF-33]OEE87780.1 protein-S-isoprenylcysteine methyltransferase [Enterovibrio norvegicus FF-162]
MDSLKLKLPPLLQVIIVMLLMKIIASATPAISFLLPVSKPLFVLLVVLGGVFAVAGVVAFRQHQTTVNPTLKTESTSLVQSGVYRITRNPMYVGFLLLLVASAFYFANPYTLLGCVLFVLYMNKFQIEPEEDYLASQFPDEYPAYKEKVRRWL